MPRGPKPAKSKEVKPPVARRSPKDDGAKVRDLEKHLAEAREQQTATAEILRVIGSSPTDVQPVFDAIANSAVRLLNGFTAVVSKLIDDTLHLAAFTTTDESGNDAVRAYFPRALADAPLPALAVRDRAPRFVSDIEADPRLDASIRRVAHARGYRSSLTVPMLQDGRPIGVITVTRRQPGPFAADEIALLQTFAAQAVMAIENVRLFNDTKEALEQQTATAEILRVISQSPTDVQPVFDTIVRSAMRLLGGFSATLRLLAGDQMELVAFTTTSESGDKALRSISQLPLARDPMYAQMVRDCQPRSANDTETDPRVGSMRREAARARGYRSVLLVPMLRGGSVIGAIAVTRSEPGPFTDGQSELLQTFAAQAVIAIENVQLFNDTKEALEQQTATSEILRVISSSPTNVQPVFDAIASRVVRLCDAFFSTVWRYDGRLIHHAADNYPTEDMRATLTKGYPSPVQPGSVVAQAISEGRIIHIEDLLDASAPSASRGVAIALGYRTLLCVPMLRDGVSIGAIAVARQEARPFSDREIKLVQTFADQAVIAIENVRLFNETKEALEQQTATAEILRVISSSPTDVQPVFDAVVRNGARLCEAANASLHVREGDIMRKVAEFGHVSTRLTIGETRPIKRTTVSGRAMIEGRTINIGDLHGVEMGREYPDSRHLPETRACLGIPLLREGGEAVGALFIFRTEGRPFTDKEMALLQTFADQAVIAIENVRLFTELQASNHDLTTALDKQTATSDILRVISQSQTDVQPVFDAIVTSAVRLLAGYAGALTLIQNQQIELAVLTRTDDAGDAAVRAIFPKSLQSVGGHQRAIRDRAPLNVSDAYTDARLADGERTAAAARGFRSWVVVPMLRDDRTVGTIGITRREAGGFSDDEIALLQTFADQAVIAIENVRLFKELQTSNRDLTTALDKQTATSDILRVISQSPTDVQPVFHAIVQSAVRLCGAIYGNVYKVNGGEIHLVAHHNLMPEQLAQWQQQYPRPVSGSGAVPRAIRTGTVGLTADWEADSEWGVPSAGVQAAQRARGVRSILIVPMFRQQEVIGAIGLTHREVAAFTNAHVELLQTFADQAVIAIENVRLFRALEEKNRALTEAHAQVTETLEQQTATAEILRVISSSPTDLQPVMDAVAENAARVCGATDATIRLIEGDIMRVASRFGAIAPVAPEVIPVDRDSHTGRAIVERRTIHIEDIRRLPETEFPRIMRENQRTVLATPLMRKGEPIGAILIRRVEVDPFTDKQIELLKTFADQAVIAIENVRLFTELQEKNRALTEAHAQVTESLEQQTASSEILRVISSSPTDVQPVFDAVAESAARLCESFDSAIWRQEGDQLRLVAHHGAIPQTGSESFLPLIPSTVGGRSVLDGRTVHIADVQTEGDEFPTTCENARCQGFRTILSVPLMRESAATGAIILRRTEAQPFTERQVALLQTFADQAVIAIENVRLFNETKEALDQQTATGDILKVIASSPTDIQPVLDAVAESSARLCGASDALIRRVEGDVLRLAAHYGPIQGAGQGLALNRGSIQGRAVLDRQTIHVHDFAAVPEEYPIGWQVAQRFGHRTMLATPLFREGVPIGAILIRRLEVQPFTDKQIALLKTFADQAVIAIENVRLFKELETRNHDLTEALDRQTATAEILRAISQSQTEVQPVFDAIVRNAVRLCGASYGGVYRFDGTLVHSVAHDGYTPEQLEHWRRQWPQPVTAGTVACRAIRTRSLVRIADVERAAELHELSADAVVNIRSRGVRSVIAVPMVRQQDIIGAISLGHRDVEAFSASHVELLKTFADQAVIAIENVRLFKELEVRTQDLTRSVGELQALSEVGQAISSTLDLQAVLSTITARATQLSGTDAGVIYEYDEPREVFVPRATEHLEAAIVETMLATPVRKGEGATGRLAEVQEPIQVPDILAAPAESRVRGALVRAGYRALLAVPLVREGHLLGGLTVIRKTTGAFAPEVIDLLQTFATQSALAIQNARLFREIEDKSRQLEVASQHKSEFLANMSHELRTPLNAIIGFSEVLSERMFGELNEKQEEYLKDIYASGTHLLSLINDILDLSKIEAGRMELELTDFHLPTALDSALTLVRERAGRRSIALHTNIDDRLGQIQADERKVRQVVLNLLSNAIKFTPEGGRIEVGATPKDGLIEVSVSDTGVGIAPEDQEAVFEEFRQVGTADKKVEGTGLGLTLCRKFVELHGGRIWVKSQLGAGSTFTFTLPLRS